jgi:hypothetical protein
MGTANPALAQMMARQLIGKLAGGAGGPGGPGAGGPPAGPGGPMPPPPGMMGMGGPPVPGGPDAGGPGGPPPPGPNAPPTTPAGLQLSQQLAELQGADPDAMVKSLTSIKSMVVSLYTRAVFTIPGVSRNLANVVKYLDNSIQEAEKAAATTSAAGPIANNAAIPNPAGQSGGMGSQPGA